MENMREDVADAALVIATGGVITKVLGDSQDEKFFAFDGTPSTGDRDLEGDIINPLGWELSLYKAYAPICFNHVRSMPIGKVWGSTWNDANGLHFTDARVTKDIALVRDYIFPMVRDQVLTKMSVGAVGMSPWTAHPTLSNTRYLERAALLENSIVGYPANLGSDFSMQKGLDSRTEAVLKTLANVRTDVDFFEAHKELLGSQTLTFTMPEIVKTEPTAVYDPEGQEINLSKSSPASKALPLTVCAGVYVAVPTEKGYKYDKTLVVEATLKVLGARNLVHLTPEARVEAVSKLAEAYAALELTAPLVSEKSLFELTPEELAVVKTADVVFANDEKNAFEKWFVVTNLNNIINSPVEKGDLPADLFQTAFEKLYGQVELRLVAEVSSLDDMDIAAFITEFVADLAKYRREYWQTATRDGEIALWNAMIDKAVEDLLEYKRPTTDTSSSDDDDMAFLF